MHFLFTGMPHRLRKKLFNNHHNIVNNSAFTSSFIFHACKWSINQDLSILASPIAASVIALLCGTISNTLAISFGNDHSIRQSFNNQLLSLTDASILFILNIILYKINLDKVLVKSLRPQLGLVKRELMMCYWY